MATDSKRNQHPRRDEDDEARPLGQRLRWLRWAIPLLVMVVAGGWLFGKIARFMPSGVDTRSEIADVSSERLLPNGAVVGFASDEETHAWLGIPYARPPVDDLRWRAPIPADAWSETLDALRKPAACPQVPSKIGGVRSDSPDRWAGSEDCLYLNVWAPRAEPGEVPSGTARWPVMVWIHGGGNTRGEGGSSMYDGAQMAGRQNLIVVSLNYRLGPLGWFSHPALREDATSAKEASGNFGTLDQIEALEWVQRNISEFGGDPNNVTIFGESAGGNNVMALLLSPLAKGLFHRAVSQSGSTTSYSRAEAEHPFDPERGRGRLDLEPVGPDGRGAVGGSPNSSAEIVVKALVSQGVVPDAEAAREYATEMADSDLVELLRSLSAVELLELVYGSEPGGGSSPGLPRLIRDGIVLPEGDWLEAFRAGRFNAVPVLLGSNRDEWRLFLAQDPKHTVRRFQVLIRQRDPVDFERRAGYASDLWKVRAVDAPANAIAASGLAPVFAYRFDWDEEPAFLGAKLSDVLGASHGFEIPFLFFNFDLGDPVMTQIIFEGDGRGRRRRLGSRMLAYWAEFARTGRPGRGLRNDLPEWLAWAEDASGRRIVFDTEEGGGIRLSEGVTTRQSVIEAIESDPSMDAAQRCELLTDLFRNRPETELVEARRAWVRGC